MTPSDRARAGGSSDAAADDFSFWDLLDIVNPLQHIPFVSSLYRELTGDTIKPQARILGDALYGGPVGLVAGLANAILEDNTGRDAGAHAIAMLDGRDSAPAERDGGAVVAVDAPEQAPDQHPGPAAMPIAGAPTPPAGTTPATAPATPQGSGPTPDELRFFGLTVQPRPKAPAAPVTAPAGMVIGTATPDPRPAPSAHRPDPIAIDSRMDAALLTFAQQASAAPDEASEPTAEPTGENLGNPQHVPPHAVPAAMMRALDLYQQQAIRDGLTATAP